MGLKYSYDIKSDNSILYLAVVNVYVYILYIYIYTYIRYHIDKILKKLFKLILLVHFYKFFSTISTATKTKLFFV